MDITILMAAKNKCILLIFIFLLLSGCTPLFARQVAFEKKLEYELSFFDAAGLIERQIRKCWRREADAFNSGVYVHAEAVGEYKAIFTATREGLIEGSVVGDEYKYSPFVKVQLEASSENNVLITIDESEYCPFFKLCRDLNYREQINEWLTGNLKCNLHHTEKENEGDT